jgi:serine/threonine protein kinase/WD40 repeat protein/Tfp pilus assembly protein PilF
VPPHPERLGDFKILRVIGEGGMGVVFEAEHESLKNRVALKVMHRRFRSDRSYLRRFQTEARSAAKLHHTNIVPVFDFGEQDGICYYAMQFIEGFGLDRVLDDVRRLRAEADPAASPEADGVAASTTKALTSPVSAVTRGLMTGRFATAPATPTGAEPLPTQPVDDGLTHSFDFQAADNPLASDPSPSETRSSTNLISGQTDLVYFREIARLGAQVADALDHAHRQKVVHRDIKPSNLLLDAQGNVWVTDFGLAKLVEGEDLSQSHDLAGTLRFMAPERFRGITDRRSDVYALGATLYEMLSLRPVFSERDHVQLIDQIAHQDPIPLRQHDRRIPRDLETVVHKVLSKDPNDRCDKAGDLRDELRRFLEGRPTRWRRVGPLEQLRRWCKRNPVIAGLNALAATLTIVIAIVSSVAAHRNARMAMGLKDQRDEANRNLILAYTTEAEARRHGRRVGQRFEALSAIERAIGLAPIVGIGEDERFRLRNEAIAATALPDFRIAKELAVPRATANGFTVDLAFERYAFKQQDGTVVVRRLSDDGELLRLAGLPPEPDVTKASFSPDGRHLAMTSRNGVLQVWDLQERRVVVTEREMPRAIPINWSFSPDGRELALGRTDSSIVFYELGSGHLLRRWTEHPVATGTLAYSPDGSKLAIQDRELDKIRIVASDSGRLLATLSQPSLNADHFAWNPRRPNLLAVAYGTGVISVCDVEKGQQTAILRGESYSGTVIAYHPDGEILASRGWHNTLRLWDTRTGRQLLSRPSSWSPTLEFDRTGRRLGAEATSEAVRILEVADATECRSLVREPFREEDRHGPVAIDPLGKRAVTTGSAVTVWDLPAAEAVATLPVTGAVHSVLFDASGAIVTELPSLLRWPVTEVPDGPVTVGPVQVLHLRGTQDGLAITPDGRTLAAAMYDDGGLVIDVHDPSRVRWLRPHPDVRFIAISPDGRWVVTGSQVPDAGLKLWDARTGRLIRDLPGLPENTGKVRCFSPDGRWLAVNRDGWLLFATSTWTPEVRLSRGPSRVLSFASDSRTVVYDDGASTAILAEVETGRVLARFEDPEQARLDCLSMEPEGSRLVTTFMDRPYLRVWDLRAIRRRLARLGLDWDPPAKLEVPDAPGSRRPVKRPCRVDLGHLDSWLKQSAESPEQTVARLSRAIEADPRDARFYHDRAFVLVGLRRFDEALADFTAAVRLEPDDGHLRTWRGVVAEHLNRLEDALADCEAALRHQPGPNDRERLASLCNNLAWALASRPAPARDPSRTLALAREAVKLVPDNAIYLNTLGVSQYRAGRYAEAVVTLEKSLATGKGGSDAYGLFFLAMAHHRLGHRKTARDCFDRAARWLSEQKNLSDQFTGELADFRAQAQALLDNLPPELPADVFAVEPRGRP